MKITKKAQIIQLYKEGLKVEDIVKKGFAKKYVNQVLKFLKIPKIPAKHHDKTTNINSIKELASLLETLENKSDKINISINISIKVDNCNTSSDKSTTSLLNPIAIFKDMGKDGLKKQLISLQLKDLLKIIKEYIPDLDGKIYKQKNSNTVIDYIIESVSKLSKVGPVFKTANNTE